MKNKLFVNMYDLEKQLHNLPKAALSKRADLRIRARLYVLLWQQKTETLFSANAWRRWYPVPVVLLLLLAIIIVPGYAYTSPAVTKQSILYPLKMELEKIETGLAGKDSIKPETYLKFSARRLEEAEVLSRQADKTAAGAALRETIKEADDLAVEAEQAAAETTGEPAPASPQHFLEQAKTKRFASLNRIAQTVGIDSEEDTLDTIAMAMEKNKEKPAEKRASAYKFFFTLPETADATTTIKGEEAAKASSTGEKNEKQAITSKPASPGSNKPETKPKEEALESLNHIVNKMESLKQDLSNENYDQDDVAKLFGRLNDKIEKAQNKIENDDWNGAGGILQSTDALTNNAKHFIKKQKNSSRSNVEINTRRQESKKEEIKDSGNGTSSRAGEEDKDQEKENLQNNRRSNNE